MAAALAYGTFTCPACGEVNAAPKVKHCTEDHPPEHPQLNITSHASARVAHLHRWCARCEREDVIPTNDGREETR